MRYKRILVKPEIHGKIKREAEKRGMKMYAIVEQLYQNHEKENWNK